MTTNDFSKHLIVIDMQNDFITGALANPDAEAILPNVIAKVDKAREAGDVRIAWTMDTHYTNLDGGHHDYMNTQEGRKLPILHCIRRTWGHELADGLSIAEDEVLYPKGTFGSWFMAEDIKKALIQKNADAGYPCYPTAELPGIHGEGMEIEFIGVCTDICVISNAMLLKAALPEARIIVDASCCAGVTPESHRTALDAMRACQIEIVGDEQDDSDRRQPMRK